MGARKSKTNIAPKVREHIKEDLAASPAGKPGIIKKISDDYGVTVAAVNGIQQTDKVDIMALRLKFAEDNMKLAARTQERMGECLEDEVRMAETPLKDFAAALEKQVGAAVTAIDGHQQIAVTNVAVLKDSMRWLEQIDSIAAEKKAKARVIDAQP